MKRFPIAVLAALSLTIVSTSSSGLSFASPSSQTEKTVNWDLPEESKLTAYRSDEAYLSTEATFRWSKDQIRAFASNEVIKQFYPSFTYTADATDRLIPKMLVTNLPGAKFTRMPADMEQGESIRLSALDINAIRSEKNYIFMTRWISTGDEDTAVSLRSAAGYAQPNGSLYELTDTRDDIATADMDLAPVKERRYPSRLPLLTDRAFPALEFDRTTWKVMSHATIDSKEALDQYKADATKRVKMANDYRIYFAITFNKPIYYNFKDMVKSHDLTLTQIYANGVKEDGSIYTVSWFDSNHQITDLLFDTKFKDFYITEVEGFAHSSDLQKLLDQPGIDTIDIEDGNGMPTGVHWLNQKFKE